MKKNLLIILIILINLISCSSWYKDDGSTDKAIKKTTIMDIADCNEPIVITMPVYKDSYLFGNKSSIRKLKRYGDIFVVIDTETNELYDWVYAEDSEGCSTWRCVEIGNNPKRYLTSSQSGKVSYIESGNNKVIQVQTNCYGTVTDNYSSLGTKTLLVDLGYNRETEYDVYRMTVFDTETRETALEKLMVELSSVNVSHPRGDSEGNFYFSYRKDNNYYILGVNTTTNEVFNVNVKDSNGESISFNYKENELLYDYTIEGFFKNQIIVYKNVMNDDYFDIPEIIFIDKETGIVKGSYKFNEEIMTADSTVFGYECIVYRDKVYCIALVPGKSIFYILEIDPAKGNEEAETFIGPIYFDLTENVWLRGSKIYLMCSRHISDVSYMYVDIESKIISEQFRLRYKDILLQ